MPLEKNITAETSTARGKLVVARAAQPMEKATELRFEEQLIELLAKAVQRQLEEMEEM